MTGNDADTISMHAPGTGTWKAHGENAYVWAAADAAASSMSSWATPSRPSITRDLADKIKADVLELMWCEVPEVRDLCRPSDRHSITLTSPTSSKYTESNNYNYFAVGLVPDDAASV